MVLISSACRGDRRPWVAGVSPLHTFGLRESARQSLPQCFSAEEHQTADRGNSPLLTIARQFTLSVSPANQTQQMADIDSKA